MSSLTPARFDEFFRALYGYGPFPWQKRLARRVAEAGRDSVPWPKALALPTAAGKTACIDIAVFALACQADRPPEERTAPRRIFFVVDRRVIVDATFQRTRDLAFQLQKAQKGEDGILKEVASHLCQLALGEKLTPEEDSGDDDPNNHPLAAFQLRGGMYRDDTWARSPLQPTVVVTTVDQFASRLLFRGYGSSAGMRPIHAGLAANDCLIVLDEAHCAEPFRQTVNAVKRYRQWAMEPHSIGSVPFHLTLLSATPPTRIKDIFRDEDEDRQHEVLGARIKVSKPAKLVEVRNRRGAEVASRKDDALDRLAGQIAAEAKTLVSEERRNIGVMVNRVHTARLVYQHLEKAGESVTLLTGRMRPIDRDDVGKTLIDVLKTNAKQASGQPPSGNPTATGNGQLLLSDTPAVPEPSREENSLFVVATQTLEVGADLDFDGLVTECASLDALRQRFGRLNRGGRDIEAQATIVVRADQTTLRRGDNLGDPIYGTALAETWQWLKERADKDKIDFGYVAMEGILPTESEEVDKLRQRVVDAPVMLPAHVDAWAQTWPVPSPDPDVCLFLHGPNRGAPEVQVCWRADLQSDMSQGRQIDVVSLCPPVSSECISTPIHILRRWLEEAGNGTDPDDNDLEGTLAPVDESPRERRQIRRSVLCWRGPEESHLVTGTETFNMLRPGDTVVIPAEPEEWEVFGHIPSGPEKKRIIDLGDRAYLQAKAKPVLRIHPKVVERWPESPARDAFMEIARSTASSEDDDFEDKIKESLEQLANVETIEQWQWLKDTASALAQDRRRKRLEHPDGGIVLQGSRRIPEYMEMASLSTSTSEDDSYSATVPVTLDDHLGGVERWARHFGDGVGLPGPLVDDLALAARLHDVGKADPRFQALLHAGHTWTAQASGRLLAKSGNLPTGRRESRRASRESGYPLGGRHELLSVRLVESAPQSLENAHDPDLVMHLIASHHGRCRPFAPVVFDREPVPVKVESTILGYPMAAKSDTRLERLDSGVPERFWHLVRRYGWWGLAWLEALLRLADHRCSEAEQRDDEDSQLGVKEAAV